MFTNKQSKSVPCLQGKREQISFYSTRIGCYCLQVVVNRSKVEKKESEKQVINKKK